jgi:hypothetical protein
MKTWTSETADARFSSWIRARDPICRRCGRRPSSDASHFFERGNSATRYDPENVDGICRICHNFFHGDRREYTAFKIYQLGLGRFNAMRMRAGSTMKRDEAIIGLMKMING